MGPKYEFTGETKNFEGRIVRHIRRLSDGKIGGWIEKEENLSQEGNCWVDDNAVVCDDAQVYGNAKIYGDGWVGDYSKLYDNTNVFDYAGLKKKVLKNKGEIYKLSPYKLIWSGDYYYVIGYSEKKGKVINFRVDRIAAAPTILSENAIPVPKDFDLENFTKEVFFMFSGDEVEVDLQCDNSLMKTMIDRFGENVKTLAYDMTSFRLITEVSASPTFFGWVFGFDGKVKILGPKNVKEQYYKMISEAMNSLNNAR